MYPDTLQSLQRDARHIVLLVKADVSKRFANIGIAKNMHLLDPISADQTGGASEEQVATALQHWAKHFGVDHSLLRSQWQYISACAVTHMNHQLATKMLPPHRFWPPLLLAHWSSAPEVCRCIGAMIILSWQHASVE